MSLQKIEMCYDGTENIFSIKGLNKNTSPEALVHVLETIKDNTPKNALFDVRIKLIGDHKKNPEILTIKELTDRIKEYTASFKDEDVTEDMPLKGTIQITFYLSNGCTLVTECGVPTAHEVMMPYEKPELRGTCPFMLFSDVHDRHYAIPYNNVTAAYCDFLEEGSETHDK